MFLSPPKKKPLPSLFPLSLWTSFRLAFLTQKANSHQGLDHESRALSKQAPSREPDQPVSPTPTQRGECDHTRLAFVFAKRPKAQTPASSPVGSNEPSERRGLSSIAFGCCSSVLHHVTGTVASYILLRKSVDQFSHGSAGCQGLVTENRHQPQLYLAFPETAWRGVQASPPPRWF